MPAEFLIVLTVLAILLGPLVLAVIAIVRTSGIRRLELRVSALEDELRRTRGEPAPQVASRGPVREPGPRPGAPPSAVLEPPPPRAAPAEPVPVAPMPPAAAAPAPAPTPHVAPPPQATRAAPAAQRVAAAERPGLGARMSGVDWERWIGLRGAALLGGVFLAFASLLLFQYSIQQGWISPRVRVGMGVGAGLAGLAGSSLLHRKGYLATANALAGGSAVALYASCWAASELYGFLSPWVWFACMTAVTATCCALAARRPSQVVAVLGLLGGFATPLLIGDPVNQAVGLFGYLLLVDLAFLFLARTRSWPSLGIVGIVGTALFETLWIARDMRPEQFVLGLAVLGTFGILFALSGEADAKRGRLRWMVSQAGGVLLPFLFAAYFAGRVELGDRLLPIAALAALLVAAASVLARRQRATWLPGGAASGAVAVLFTWSVSSDVDASRAWQLVGCALGLVGVLLAFGGWRFRGDAELAARLRAAQGFATALAAAGFSVVLIGTGVRTEGMLPWPWLVGTAGLVLAFARASALARRGALQLPGAAALATAWFALIARHGDRPDGWFPGAPVVHAGIVAGALLLVGLALVRRDERGRRWAWGAVVLYGAPAGFATLASQPTLEAPLAIVLGASALLAAATVLASAALRSGAAFAVSASAAVLFQTAWCITSRYRLENADALPAAWIALFAFTAALVHAPLLARRRFAERSAAWIAAALVPWVAFLALAELFDRFFADDRGIGLVPLALALPLAVAAWRVRGEGLARRGGGIALAFPWYAAVAASLASIALPMEVDRHVLHVALALFALATAWLWVPCDRLALKVVSLASLALATAIALGSALDGDVRRGEALVWNDASWAALVPALAALGVVLALRVRERPRLRPLEGGRAWGAGVAGLACVALVFAWISLEIFNHYGVEQRIDVLAGRLQERDLTLSIAWAIYALVLLVLGMRRAIGALRWVSLTLFIVTIAKVFLYDLASLEGLYRVGSMFGLAVSLLIVSLLYQRLVFRSAPARTRRAPGTAAGEEEAPT